MNLSTVITTVKDNLPHPIEYFKDIARGDTPSRVSAVLALMAGITLVAGFIVITIAITKYDKKLTTELITVSGALVTLATFSKIDRNSISTTQVTSDIDNNITTNKPDDKKENG